MSRSRSQARYQRSIAPEPGRFVAVCGDGRTYQSPAMASRNVRRVRRIYESDGQVAVGFTTPHPFETGEELTGRVLGWDGATTFLHRANGWGTMPGDVKRNGYSTVPDANGVHFGGAAQAIERLDDTNILLTDVPWKIRDEDPDPVFLGAGQFFRREDLVDVRAWYASAMAWIGDEPFSSIHYGAGFFVFQHPGNTTEKRTWDPPANFAEIGAGPDQTILFRDDYYNATRFHFTRDGGHQEGFTEYGNRPFQLFATHGTKVTGPEDELPSGGRDDNIRFYTIRNVTFEDIPGYGINMGHPGGKRWFRIEGVTINGTTNDGMDVKGPHDENELGLYYFNKITDCSARNMGLLYLGTNRTKPLTLAKTNPITTQGNASVIVWTGQQAYLGQRLTFGGDTPDQDGVVFAGRSFKTTGTARDVGTGLWKTTIDVTPQAATGSSDGGGTGVEVTMPACNQGKPGFDGRGKGLLYSNIHVGGYLLRNRPLRLRGNDGGPGNGSGGHDSQVLGITVVDETPAALGYQAGGLNILSRFTTLANYKYVGNGLSGALSVSGTASDFLGRGITVRNAVSIGAVTAANASLDVVATGCTNGLLLDGTNSGLIGSLDDDPLLLTAGSTVVQLTWSSDDPNRPSSTDEFTIGGVEPSYGTDLNGSWTCIDSSNASYITFDGGQEPDIASGTVQTGGDEVTYSRDSGLVASGYFRLEMDDMGSGYGVKVTQRTDPANIRIDGSYFGAGTPVEGLPNRVRWGANNLGLPNNRKVKFIESPGTLDELTRDDGGILIEVKGTIGGQAVIPLPTSGIPAGTEFPFYTRSGFTSSLLFQAQGSDKIHVGASASSAGGTLAANSVGASGVLVRASEDGQWAWYVLYATGTMVVT